MSIPELLRDLRQLDIRLWADGDRLRFSAPRGALTDSLKESIRNHRDELLQFFRSAASADAPSLTASSNVDRHELSFSQKRIWFHERLGNSGAAWHIPGAYRISGDLNIDAFGRALHGVIQRHPALRTEFHDDNGIAFARVRPTFELPLKVVDLTMSSDSIDSEATKLLEDAALQPFDLTKSPLLRVVIVCVDDTNFLLGITMHHLISDGWSIAIFLRDLASIYQTELRNVSFDQSELPFQYADFSNWQREVLTGQRYEELVLSWKNYLNDAPPVVDLPTDRPRPATQTFDGAEVSRHIPTVLTEAVFETSRKLQVTPFVVCLSAFYVLIHRYTRQSDIVLGTPISGRHEAESEKIVGLFVNTLALRCRLAAAMSAKDIIHAVRDSVLDTDAWKDLPFEMLVEEMNPARDHSRSPIYQVLFSWLNISREPIEVSGLSISPVSMPNRSSKLDLSLCVEEVGGQLIAAVEFNTDLFDAGRMEALLGHYEVLLAQMTSGLECRLSELEIMPQEERLFVQTACNQTDAPLNSAELIHDRFEMHCRQAPDAIAIVFKGSRVSYAELNRRATDFAARLQEHGVKPADLVGVCVNRSIEMVVAILGVFKSGAAYLPIDPELPQDRITFILEDSGLALFVCSESSVPMTENNRIPVLTLEASSKAQRPVSDTRVRVRDESLAYVIYTSGSTGRPKGVQITHRSAVNFLQSMASRPGLGKTDVLVAVTTLSFDISVLELLLPLSTGACVVVASAEVASNGQQLALLINESRATVAQATPATWQMLLEAGWKAPGRFCILCGGEAMPLELAARLISAGSEVWNLYGPTETTVWSAVHSVDLTDGSDPVSIGRPIGNTQIYVLDEDLHLVPPGVPGELFIGGAGLARGYLNRPALTAEKFVPDPYSGTSGARLYRTGDRVVLSGDGILRYIERLDFQLKLRGYRIESGEIEAVLLQHSAVRQAAVVLMSDAVGYSRLVAFLVIHPDCDQLGVSELTDLLRRQIPQYMVPAQYVFEDALPLNVNGKLDRKALAARTVAATTTDAGTYIGPRNRIESELAVIWAEVLGRETVGIRDNFFEHGGHSLLAVHLLSRMKRRFGDAVSLTALFRSPTIEATARLIADQAVEQSLLVRLGADDNSVSDARRDCATLAEDRQVLFLVPGAAGNPFSYTSIARHLGADFLLYGFHSTDALSDSAAPESIPDMAATYVNEMKRLRPTGPYSVAGHSFGAMVAFEMSRQLQAQGEYVNLLAVLDLPARPTTSTERDESEWLAEIGDAVSRFSGAVVRLKCRELRGMSSHVRKKAFLAAVIAAGVLPEESDLPLVDSLLEVYQRSETMLANYKPPPYNGPITLIRSEESNLTDEGCDKLGWSEITSGEVEVLFAAGDHITMITEPNVASLAGILRRRLVEVWDSARNADR